MESTNAKHEGAHIMTREVAQALVDELNLRKYNRASVQYGWTNGSYYVAVYDRRTRRTSIIERA